MLRSSDSNPRLAVSRVQPLLQNAKISIFLPPNRGFVGGLWGVTAELEQVKENWVDISIQRGHIDWWGEFGKIWTEIVSDYWRILSALSESSEAQSH